MDILEKTKELILKMVIKFYNILIKKAIKKGKMDLVEECKEEQNRIKELIRHEKLRNELMKFAKKIDL